MEQPPQPPPDAQGPLSDPLPGEYGYDDYDPGWMYSPFFYYAVLAFTIWMMVDSYKRHGLSYWLWIIFIFQPIGGIVYLIIHAKQIFSGVAAGGHRGAGAGPGLFGLGLRNRIAEKERELRMADTEAARAELGALYFEAKRYDDAAAQFERVLAVDPEDLDATYHLGMCRRMQGDRAAAQAQLEKVLAQEKKYKLGSAWLAYTECLVDEGRMDEALEERRALARAFPRPMMEFAYAELLHQAGQHERAREVLQDMLDTAHQAPPEDRTYLKQGKRLLRALPA